ncbi:MAG: alpha/beta hydrolase [Cyclobacteriaceae bacterium]
MNQPAKSKTIVFIHGLFNTPLGWDEWITYFEAKGYTCHAPAYPFHDGNPSKLRNQVDPELGNVTFGDVTRHLLKFIEQLPEKPIVIGHSMGGLVVQKLIEMDKALVGVCINSAPPKGIKSTKWSFLKSNFPVVNPLKGNSVFEPSKKWFHYAFCNTMSREASDLIYEKNVVPESRNIPRSSTKNDGKIDLKKPHNPLLFIAGEMDHIIPVSLNQKNVKAYKDPASKREIKVFEGRTHYICGQDGWQEVAGYIQSWLAKL